MRSRPRGCARSRPRARGDGAGVIAPLDLAEHVHRRVQGPLDGAGRAARPARSATATASSDRVMQQDLDAPIRGVERGGAFVDQCLVIVTEFLQRRDQRELRRPGAAEQGVPRGLDVAGRDLGGEFLVEREQRRAGIDGVLHQRPAFVGCGAGGELPRVVRPFPASAAILTASPWTCDLSSMISMLRAWRMDSDRLAAPASMASRLASSGPVMSPTAPLKAASRVRPRPTATTNTRMTPAKSSASSGRRRICGNSLPSP